MKINIAVEITEESRLQTKVSLHSFIEKNAWFNGTVYLLTSSYFPISEKTFAEISSLYPTIEIVNVDLDDRISKMMHSSKHMLTSCMLSHLKMGTFLIDGPVLYISQKSIFFSDISFFIEDNFINFSSLFNQDTSSIFYLGEKLNKNELLSTVAMLVLEDTTIPPNRRLSNFLVAEFNKIGIPSMKYSNKIVSASKYLDRYFNKFRSSLKEVSCLHFNDGVFNSPLYTKINQIWLHTARSVALLLTRPLANRSTTKAVTATPIPHTPVQSFKDDSFSVSIIIPAFKAHNYIKDCLDSIKNQKTLASIEILVGIDNCEETLSELNKIAKDYPNMKVFFSNKSIGAYVMRNSLIEFTSHENLLFFDADDIMKDGMIATILYKYTKNQPIRFKYFNFTHGANPIIHNSLNKGVAHGVFFINKALFDKIGGFQDWLCGADSDFMKRCVNNKILDLHILSPLFYRRIHSKSLTQDPSTGFKSTLRNEIAIKIKNTRVWPIPLSRVTSKLQKIK
jgi:hypothetical protein